jgi:hypothetical protein
MLFTRKPKDVTPKDAAAALTEGKLTLVDVRHADERAGMLAWEKADLSIERTDRLVGERSGHAT